MLHERIRNFVNKVYFFIISIPAIININRNNTKINNNKMKTKGTKTSILFGKLYKISDLQNRSSLCSKKNAVKCINRKINLKL